MPSSPSHTDRDDASSAVASNTTSASAAASAGVAANVGTGGDDVGGVLGGAVPDDDLVAVAQQVDRHPAADHAGSDHGDTRAICVSRCAQNAGPTVTVTGAAAPKTSAITRLASSSVTFSQRASCSSTLCTLPSVMSIPPRRLIRAAVSSRPSW